MRKLGREMGIDDAQWTDTIAERNEGGGEGREIQSAFRCETRRER